MKRCCVCKKLKSVSEFYKNSGKRDGLDSRCKPCSKERGRAWYAENKTHRKRTQKAWAIANSAKIAAATARYKKRYPAKIKAYEAATRAQKSAYHRKWYADNLESKRAKNRAWAKQNPVAHIALCAKRRAAELRALPKWANLKAIENVYREARRLTQKTGVRHEVDHIFPLQGRKVCGLHVEANLQVLPMVHNRSKSNKLLELA